MKRTTNINSDEQPPLSQKKEFAVWLADVVNALRVGDVSPQRLDNLTVRGAGVLLELHPLSGSFYYEVGAGLHRLGRIDGHAWVAKHIESLDANVDTTRSPKSLAAAIDRVLRSRSESPADQTVVGDAPISWRDLRAAK